MAFSYSSKFQDALAALKREGRYRVFADILRERGAYPNAGLFENGTQ
jgi:5-aminolevulinate synthase